MSVKKININQQESSYYIASDIYDVSAHNDGATFESLSALLSDSNLSTLIPSEMRCGGMSIRFIQSSDNKYVQYRLMSTSFSTIESDWQGVDDEPTLGSDNLVKSDGVANKLAELENQIKKDSIKYFDANSTLDLNKKIKINSLFSELIIKDINYKDAFFHTINGRNLIIKAYKDEQLVDLFSGWADASTYNVNFNNDLITIQADFTNSNTGLLTNSNKSVSLINKDVYLNILEYRLNQQVKDNTENIVGLGKIDAEAIDYNIGYQIIGLNVALGETIPIEYSNMNGWKCAVIDCVQGDKFIINGTGGGSPRLWAFLSYSNVLLSVSASNATGTELELTAPENAAKLIINDKSDKQSYKGYYILNDVKNRLTKIESKNSEFTQNVESLKGGMTSIQQDINDIKDSVFDSIDYTDFAYIPTQSYYQSMGHYLASHRLESMINTAYINQQLNENDILQNTAGKTCLYNNNLYVLKYHNDILDGINESKYLYLCKIDLLTKEVIYDKVYDVGDLIIDNITYNVISNVEGIPQEINGVICTISNLFTDKGIFLVCKKFNSDNLNLISVNKCKLTVNGINGDFSTDFILQQGLSSSLLKSAAIANAGVCYYNGYYYGAFGTDKKGAMIMKTNDFINWEYVFQTEDYTQGEVAIYIDDNGNMYLCARPASWDLSNIQYIKKYDIKTFTLKDKVKIRGGLSLPNFFKYNNRLYLFCPSPTLQGDSDDTPYNSQNSGRWYYQIIQVNEYSLANSMIVCDTNHPNRRFGPNTTLSVSTDGYIYGCKINKWLEVVRFTIPNISIDEVKTIMNNIINI